MTESKDARAPAAQSAITAHNELLRLMEQITNDLTDAVGDSRMSDVEKLLNDRAVLCEKIGASSSAVRQGGARDSVELVSRPGADRERETPSSRARQSEARILEKQSVCEKALQERLRECRSALASLKQRKGLKAAYSPTSEANPACFLDNRM